MKQWPNDPATITIGFDAVSVSPSLFIDSIEACLPHWNDPPRAAAAQAELNRLRMATNIADDYWHACLTRGLADASVYCTLGFQTPTGRQYCIDTLQGLVP